MFLGVRIRPWMILALAAIIVAGVFIGTFFSEKLGGPAKTALNTAAAPVVEGTTAAAGGVRNFFKRLFALAEVDKEHERLKQRVAMLEMENQYMGELLLENERLTALLGFREKYPTYVTLQARVIGNEPGGWFMNFVLNRGAKHGIRADMAVVNADGLVGRVVEVSWATCRVMAIIDRTSAVSAVMERTRDNCIAGGATDMHSADPLCDISYLPDDAEITPGDRVLTSSIGGIFPKGILIGTVTEVSRDQNLNRSARLRAAVDFAHLENVLIITGEAEATPADAQPADPATPAQPTDPNGTADPDDTAAPSPPLEGSTQDIDPPAQGGNP